MNKDQLAKCLYCRVRLRPVAKRFSGTSQPEPFDDDWIIEAVDKKTGITITSTTRHFTLLGFDHILEFISDPDRDRDGLKHGFLKLKVQITLQGRELGIEPL